MDPGNKVAISPLPVLAKICHETRKQVSNDGHQMSLAGGRGQSWGMSHVWCLGGTAGAWMRGACTVRSNVSWVMVTWESPYPPCAQKNTHLWKITFPQFRWRAVKMPALIYFFFSFPVQSMKNKSNNSYRFYNGKWYWTINIHPREECIFRMQLVLLFPKIEFNDALTEMFMQVGCRSWTVFISYDD